MSERAYRTAWIVMVIMFPANLDRHPSADLKFGTPMPRTDAYGLANEHAWRISSDDLKLHFSDGATTALGSEAGSDLETIQAGIGVQRWKHGDSGTRRVRHHRADHVSRQGYHGPIAGRTGNTTIWMDMPVDTSGGSAGTFENDETGASVRE